MTLGPSTGGEGRYGPAPSSLNYREEKSDMGNGDGADPDAFGEFGVAAHVIQKSASEQLRIGINECPGQEYIDMRAFFDPGDGYRPTKRGITLPTRLYSEVLRGVLELGVTLGAVDQDAVLSVFPE